MNPRPYVLLAELTYGCPLHCPYCSNPTGPQAGLELETEEWNRVFRQAAELGVLHLGLSGGEPLLRRDLPELVAAAHAAGLDSIQLSFQADEELLADTLAGTRVHRLKIAAAAAITQAGLPLSLNVVLHRANIERLAAIIGLAENLGAHRLELANVQYYGWAFLNRRSLLPTREQSLRALEAAQSARERLQGRMEIVYVLPDYFETRPKPCMQGWGSRYLTINPYGHVLPCPNATSIPDLQFENVREHPLAHIWHESASFNRFRGEAWMPLPCRDCPERTVDFGGCRCQAALLTGDSAATDPVCDLSPHHALLQSWLDDRPKPGMEPPLQPRQNPAPVSFVT
jgi:pyrroloquinoline quinone biosynthesis protein E